MAIPVDFAIANTPQCVLQSCGYTCTTGRSLPAQRFFSAKVKAGLLPVQKANPMNF